MDAYMLLLLLVTPLLLEAQPVETHSRHREKNEYRFVGSHLQNGTGVFTSPNFPDRYPGGYHVYSYLLENSDGGHVKLIFDDFLLADEQLDNCKICRDGNCTEGLYMYHYGTNRPGAVISMGSQMKIEFTSVSDAHVFAVGFKATYQFVSSSYWEYKPQVAGIFHNEPSRQLFYSSRDWWEDINVDVVWSIKAPTSHQIWLRFNVSLSYDFPTPAIVIRDGITSEGYELGYIPGGSYGYGEYSVFSNSDGMYVRLKTTMKGNDQNNYDFVWGLYVEYIDAGSVEYECPDDYYLCSTTDMCVSESLTCDSVNHCGDWSDESTYTCADHCSGCYHGNCQCYSDESCKCICDEGYYGENCEKKDDCPYCYNGGYCDTISHICVCPESFYGAQCEYYYSDGNSYYTILYICGGLIGLVLTCLCSLALSRRRYSGRRMPSTISATAGFTEETDYANSFHQFNSDTERLADPNMFYNMDAPPEYSVCVNADGVASHQLPGHSDSSQSGRENADSNINVDGIPDEPPPSYDDCTSGQPMLENSPSETASATSGQNQDNPGEPKEESELNPNESTA